jgi:hypothetical protein
MNLDIEKNIPSGVMVRGIDTPTVFNVKITNLDRSAELKFMNFEGFVFEPESVKIKEDETKEIELKIYPKENFDYLGYYIFKYSIFSGEERIDEELILKLIKLENAFEVGANDFDPESSSLEIYIKNKENFNFENLNVKFSSAFFEREENFNLGPNEKKSFSVNLNKEDFKKLIAGFYTLDAQITSMDEKANVDGVIKFIEKDIVTTEKREYGFVISSKIIKKENKGNVVVDTETTIKKNIISRLFTSFSPEPDKIDRNNYNVYYFWNKSVKPGETLEIIVKTNWMVPFLLILVIVSVVVVTKKSSQKNLIIKKKVTLIKSKGGEFALRVTLNLRSRDYLERIRLTDRLPPLVKIYEKFGAEKPIRIDERNKRIEWAFEKLEAGETRTISYVLYSKVAVLGRFILPSAIAVFEKNGKVCEETSNQSFLMAETGKRED